MSKCASAALRRALAGSVDFSHDEGECFFRIFRFHAGGDIEDPNVIEESERTIDGIGQPMVFAHDLEKSRAHVFSQ